MSHKEKEEVAGMDDAKSFVKMHRHGRKGKRGGKRKGRRKGGR